MNNGGNDATSLGKKNETDAKSKKGECKQLFSRHLCVEILSDLLHLLSPKSCRAVVEKIVRLKMNKLLKHSILRIGEAFVHRAGGVFRP